MANKTTEVLKHLQEHGSITSMEAIELFGATRLSAIIFNLRRHGHDIATVNKEGVDRYGHNVRFAKYVYQGLSNTATIENAAPPQAEES